MSAAFLSSDTQCWKMPENEMYMVGVVSELPWNNFENAVLNGVQQATYSEHTERQLNDPAMLWGYREKNKSTWRQLDNRDFLLFYTGEYQYRYAAQVADTEQNYDLGDELFATPDQTFEYIVYLNNLREISINSRELHQTYAGYDIGHPVRSQGFNDATYQAIAEGFGSVEEYISAHQKAVVSGNDVDSGAAVDIERPQRVETKVNRIVRDTTIVDELKELYGYKCQVCGDMRRRDGSEPYAEGHHIRPLGDSPPGPDKRSNIIVLCPNHHADFDYGMVRVDPDTYEIDHEYDFDVDGKQISIDNNHQLMSRYLKYHNREIAVF